ncbi:MAG: hypothetical protein KC503_13420 [Myxococcales bacterium]|nr:hypothetical protein [Myxococcales bacterium]
MSKWLEQRVGERGSVLVLALLVTLLILGIGLSVMWVSSSGNKSSGNVMRRQEALYSAEAGVERARAILNAAADWTALLKGGSPNCTPTPVAQDPNKGRILCDTTTNTLMQDIQVIEASTPTATATANKLANLKYTIWIRNDPIDAAGSATGSSGSGSGSGSGAGSAGGPETDTDFRVIVRAEGKGRDGLSFVALEAVVSRNAYAGAAMRYQQAGINAQGNSSFRGSIAAP